MIFDNIDFHNVSQLNKSEKGYLIQRLPESLCQEANPKLTWPSQLASGCELRFKIKGDEATIILNSDFAEEATTAYIYFGGIQGGWMLSSKVIFPYETKITIKKPENMAELKKLSIENGLGFDPEVVRIVLPYGRIYYVGVEGEVEPPEKSDLPSKTYLAYGSSITHGSLALASPYTYPFRVAQRLGCDYINMGFAGSARMEKEIAEYIVARKDWDFASLEMGINALDMSCEEFEKRVREFVDILASDPRPIYATCIYHFNGGGQEKGNQFREIVRKCTEGKLNYTNGLEFLNNPAFIAHDMVHPSLEGIESIANKWYEILKNEA